MGGGGGDVMSAASKRARTDATSSDVNLIAQLVDVEGAPAGPELDLPPDVGVKELQSLLRELLRASATDEDDDRATLPYAFYVDGEEVTRGDEDSAPGAFPRAGDASRESRIGAKIFRGRPTRIVLVRCHSKTATPRSVPSYAVPAGGSTVTSACALSHSMLFLASIASPACSTSLCTSYSVP